jgi:RND family efflux transporter MFP subunit
MTSPGDGVSDAQLLERFISTRDEAAFELLVWRHQRLVLGVCRRVLQNFHEAEDAFQATFLVLARKAGGIGKRKALASWLYKVAYRVALTARARQAKRAAREQPLGPAQKVAAPPEPTGLEQRDLWAVVDEEVSRLPERFRAATVLCYLEGKTVEEAALQLGCPRGTVASRLGRARERLRARLTRRGVALTTGAVATALSQAGMSAAMPAGLIRSAVRAAALSAAGKTVSGPGIPLPVAALTEEVLRTMFLKKLMIGVAILVVLSGILSGGGLLVRFSAKAAAEPMPLPAVENATNLQDAGEEQQPGEKEHRPAAPWQVTVSRPVQREAAPFQDFVARLEAIQNLTVRARVTGRLQRIYFKSGEQIKKGDLLFEIDPAAYRATLAKAEIDLAAAEARRKQAERDWQRARKLLASGALAREDFDKVAAEFTQTEAGLRAARLVVEHAKQNLEATRVVAEVDGTIGTPNASPGDQVFGGEHPTYLVNLMSPNAIGIRFDMDERSLLRYRRLLVANKVQGIGSPLFVGLADEVGFPHQGKLDYFNDRLNPNTATIDVHGILPNPDGLLLPGMFARVRMPVGPPRPVLEVTEEAVGSDKDKRYVLVVNDRNVVEWREVKVGQQDSGMRIIEDGLRPEDWVVTAGGTGPRPGDKVEPRRVAMPRSKVPGKN